MGFRLLTLGLSHKIPIKLTEVCGCNAKNVYINTFSRHYNLLPQTTIKNLPDMSFFVE